YIYIYLDIVQDITNSLFKSRPVPSKSRPSPSPSPIPTLPAWTYKEIHYETDDEIYGEELQNEEKYVRIQGEGGVQGEAEYLNIMEKMTTNILRVYKKTNPNPNPNYMQRIKLLDQKLSIQTLKMPCKLFLYDSVL